MYFRQDQAAIHVTVTIDVGGKVTGINFPAGPWQSLEGGDVQAESLKTRAGGLMPGVSLGGPTSRTDATVKRLYDAGFHKYIVDLENATGQSRMSISYTPLDSDANPAGGKVTMTGTLKNVMHPTFDADASGPAVLTLVMDCDAEATIG